MTKKVAVVVPFYRTPTVGDRISLKHLNKYLGKYDKFVLTSESLQIDFSKHLKAKIIRFPNSYFISPKTYNHLMTDQSFYQKFANYEYILIYQLDALVFSDELLKWCKSKFDYIGAPSFFSLVGKLTHIKSSNDFVLNGGLSLRKVTTFIQVLKKAGVKAQKYPFNEDGFWSFEAPKYDKNYKLPDFKTALSFAFEKNPQKCFKLNGNKLPFGCHAWERYDKDFWKPYLI